MEVTPELLEAVRNPPSIAFLGALIGGAVSLVGGLAGRSDAKKRDKAAAEAAKVPVVTSHTVDLPGLVRSAEEAGFNPQTILNAGGLSAFTTTSTTGQNAMAAVPTAPSFGSVLAGAAGTAFNIYREDMDRKTAALSSFPPAPKLGMAEALGWTAGGGKALGGGARFGAVPTMARNGGRAAMAGMPTDGRAIRPSVETPTMTNPNVFYSVDPTQPDAEMMETRKGDSEVNSFLSWARVEEADFLYNLTGTTAFQRAAFKHAFMQNLKNEAREWYGNTGNVVRNAAAGIMSASRSNRANAARNYKRNLTTPLPTGNWLDGQFK